MLFRRLVLSALVVLWCANWARAQWSSDPAVNLPIANAGNDQVQAKIRLTPDGGAYVSWFDQRTGGYDVYLQRINENGVEQWTHNGVLIADRSVSSTEDYGLAVDAAGNAVMSYGLVNYSSFGVQKISQSGALQWGPTGITFNTPSGSHAPRITVTNDDYSVVGWSVDSAPPTIVLQKLDANGASQWGAGVVITDSASRPILLSDLEPGDDGSVIALWMRCSGSNCVLSNRQLHAQKFNSAGAAQWNGGSPVVVFDGGSIQLGTFPTFVSDGSGGAVFGWYDVGGDRNAYAQHVNAAGAEVFPHNGVASTGSTPGAIRISASVAFDPANQETFLAWTESTTPTQNQWAVRAQKYSPGGVRQWGNGGATIQDFSFNQNGFVRALAYGGGCIVHYFDDRGGGAAVVLGARLDSTGSLGWHGAPVTVSSRLTGKARLDAILDGCGMSMLVWSDGASGGSQDLLAQNVRADGSLGPLVIAPGDMNCSGQVNLADVDGFVQELLDPPGYAASHPCCDGSAADMNGDGRRDGGDVDGFVGTLAG